MSGFNETYCPPVSTQTISALHFRGGGHEVSLYGCPVLALKGQNALGDPLPLIVHLQNYSPLSLERSVQIEKEECCH